NRAVDANRLEAGALEHLRDLRGRVEALGVELIDNDAALGVDDHLARDEALAVGGERALAADQMVLVDPLPGAALEALAHPVAVHEVERDGAAGLEDALGHAEHGEVVLLALEIAERVAHKRHALERALGQAEAAGVALVEGDGQAGLFGALAG